MNSSAQPTRRIASNLLWTPQGLVRNPLVTLSAEGRLLRVESCPEPDRRPATEFYSGLLVAGFPADYRAAFVRLRESGLPLGESLPALVRPDGVVVVLSGLHYDTLRLTPRSAILKL